MNTFTLTINMGNDAMQTPEDVAEALRDAARDIETGGKEFIYDINGNKVGLWVFTS